MRFLTFILVLVTATPAVVADEKAFLSTYCLKCHGEEKQKGDRQFNLLDQDFTKLETIETWQEILDQINLGEMPPEDEKQPDTEETRELVEWITAKLKMAHESLSADLARPVMRRLNKVQYDHTVRSLLDLGPMLMDPTESFPPEIEVENFDRIGSALVTSDFLMQSYLNAAGLLIEKATCQTADPPEVKKWKFTAPFCKLPARPDGLDEDGKYQHIRKNNKYEDGFLWLSKFVEGVPHDGYYELTFKAQAINRDYPYPEEKIRVNKSDPLRVGVVAGHPDYGDLKAANGSDRPLFELDLPDDKPETIKRRVWLDKGFQPRFCFPNGPNRTKPFRSFTVRENPEHFREFIKYLSPKDGEFRGLPEAFVKSVKSELRNKKVTDSGKKLDSSRFYTNKNSNGGWSAWTRAYEGPRVRIYEISLEGPFYDQWPTTSHEILYSKLQPTLANSDEILRNFARRAFRRDASPEEIKVLADLVNRHAAAGNSEKESVQAGLQAILCSPSFLYLDPETSPTNLASQLSYFLWSDMPDAALSKADLSDSNVFREQVERLLSNNRINTFVEEFTDSWLRLDKVGTQLPSHSVFPEYFTHDLEYAMLAETQAFFRHLLDENLPITNFLDSDFAFLNGNLARHYGIDNVSGHALRKVKLNDPRRGGLLGQASIATASANGIDTSPVIRGIWILENLLGDPPNPPPPDIEPIEPDIRGVTTIREQLMKHRSVETCAECHRKIDPLGFAMENFDPIGGWRSKYMQTKNRPPVDASGQFPDGRGFKDIVELKAHLLNRKHQFAHCLTEKMLTYATGRTMNAVDRPHIDKIVDELEKRGWGLRDLVLLVAGSEPFRG